MARRKPASPPPRSLTAAAVDSSVTSVEPFLPQRTVTASAAPMSAEHLRNANALPYLRQAWWERAWDNYDNVPPIHYGANYMANAISRLRLVGARVDPANPHQPKAVGNGSDASKAEKAVYNAVRRLRNPKGGQRQILKALGLNLFVPGEVYLFGTGTGEDQSWEAVSTFELDASATIGGTIIRKRFPGDVGVPIPEDCTVIRIWQEHPRWSAMADSPMQACLEHCETYRLLTRAARSIALSRIGGAGILFVPQELLPPAEVGGKDSTEPEQESPFMTDFYESIMTPIADDGDPANVVPLVLTGPAEFGEKIRHILLNREFDQYLVELKNDAVRQMATATDLPADVLLGQTNEKGEKPDHFTSAIMRQETFTSHIQPFAESIVDALTAGYLHPQLKQAGVEDWQDYYIWFDASELVFQPDKTEAATQAKDRLVLNNEGYLRALGLDPADALDPDSAEYRRAVGIKLADANMAVTGEVPPSESEKMDRNEQLQRDTMAAAAARDNNNNKGGRPVEGTVPDSASRSAPKGRRAAPPEQKGERRIKPGAMTAAGASVDGNLGYQLGLIDVHLMARVRTIIEAAVHRTAERMGAKLRSKVQHQPELRASIDGLSNEEAALHLSSMVASLNLGEVELIRQSLATVSDEFASAVLDAYDAAHDVIDVYLGLRTLTGDPIWGALRALREGAVEEAVEQLPDLIVELVRRYVFEKPSLSDTTDVLRGETDRMLVGPGSVRDIIVRAGGGSPDGSITLTGGVATGRAINEYLAALGVPSSNARIWLYGQTPRKQRFQGHAQLDGLVFEDWQSPDLAVWPEDAWLHTDHYRPGDHYGCACVTAPYIPNLDAPYQIEA